MCFGVLLLPPLFRHCDANIMQTASPTIASQLGGMRVVCLDICCLYVSKYSYGPIVWEIIGYVRKEKAVNYFRSIVYTRFDSFRLCQFHGHACYYQRGTGLGAGGMVPLSMIIVGDCFPIDQRGKIQAVFSTIWALASIVGPVLGSFFVEALMTWRWIFFINIPIGIATVLC